MYYDARKLH